MRRVLEDVSLTIPTDQSVGILGRTGGKSTLLRLVAGIESPNSGKVVRHVRFPGRLDSQADFITTLTGEENMRFVSRIYGFDPAEVGKASASSPNSATILHAAAHLLESGMRARLAFGLSMAIDFQVYLIDEVIAVGDRPFREK